jgi:hypothetical protein
MEKKKTIKKIKSVTKGMTKKTELFLKRTSKEASGIAGTIEKQWKKERPQREKLKKVAQKALANGIKISGDVFKTIRKDIYEIKRQGKK